MVVSAAEGGIGTRYTLRTVVAKGPRGTTWAGVDHARLDVWPGEREVFVKVMEPGSVPRGWEDVQLRTGLIGHPGLMSVVGAGYDGDERPYLVTRWRSAVSSVAHVEGRGPLSVREGIALALMVSEALTRCHRLGVVHLNLKPDNVLVADEGLGLEALVTDFGLLPAGASSAFAAPELLMGGRGSVRSDVYGLGVLLLAWLTGRDPIGGPLREAVSVSARVGLRGGWAEAVAEQVAKLPTEIRQVVSVAVSAEPSSRHRSVAALARELRSALYPSSGALALAELMSGSLEWAGVEGARDGVGVRAAVIEGVEVEGGDRAVVRLQLRHRDGEGGWRRSRGFAYRERWSRRSTMFASLQHAWPGAEVHLQHATSLRRAGETFYTDNARTQVVLEPYFPIAVTPIVAGEGCGSRPLVDLRDGGGSNRNLVVGKIVHAMMEAMLVPAAPSGMHAHRGAVGHDARSGLTLAEQFGVLFDEVCQEHRLELLAAGQTSADRVGIEETARKHFLNLSALVVRDELSLEAGAYTEVTRFSGDYGLEGRIDLAFDDGQVFRIVELKTGNAWRDHGRQVHCYGLLWEDVAQALGRRVHGELLYSRAGRLKPVDAGDAVVKRAVLETRNVLVAMHRHLAFGDTGYRPPRYLEDPDRCFGAGCKFRRHRCEVQNKVLGDGSWGAEEELAQSDHPWFGVDPELVKLARAYYRRFVRFVEAEWWASNAKMGQILRREALGDRVASLEAVSGLEVTSVNVRLGRVTFRGEGLQILSAGQEVIAHRGDMSGGHLVRGQVWGMLSDMVTISSPASLAVQVLPRDGWVLELPPARIGHRTAHRALFDFMRGRDVGRLAVLLQRRAPEVLGEVETAALAAQLPHLNPSQVQAVAGALVEQPAYLIQGPPGTGKTTVIAELILQLVARGQRVMLSAGTNTAVDNVLSRLVERGYSAFVRFGDDGSSEELVWRLRRAGVAPEERFARSLARSMDDLDALSRRLSQVQVFAGTTHRAVSSAVIEILERQMMVLREEDQALPVLFDVAILDEASQVPEPMALGAINRARRFVLVGDHRQLPPVVTAEGALGAFIEASESLLDVDDEVLVEEESPEPSARAHARVDRWMASVSGVRGLDQSLFERLAGHVPGTRLKVQYRSNAAIMALSSRAFYDGDLQADQAVTSLELPVVRASLEGISGHIAAILDPSFPLVMVDVVGTEDARQNQAEAHVVLELISALLRPATLGRRDGARPFDPARRQAEIGVISPFRAQVQLLRRMMRGTLADGARGIVVDTVERFQGQEREVMLVSMVASGRTSAHLADARRLNVTLTRARSKLVVIGNLDTLARTSLLFERLIEQPETHIIRSR